MLKLKIQVGHYYTLTLKEDHIIAFAVLYGFERGKNKDVYTLRMFTNKGNFEFPIKEITFDRWVNDGRVQEITAEETLDQTL